METSSETTPIALPLTFKTIYDALFELLPDHYLVIMHSIKRLVILDKEVGNFGTMGINRFGNLIVCRPFWEQYITNMNALKLLLYHELLHHVSGDVYSISADDEDPEAELKHMANNIAMDSRINAFICNSMPEIKPEIFLEQFYSEENIKDNVFGKMLKPTGIFTSSKNDRKLQPFHIEFYKDSEFCNHEELAEVVLEILKEQGAGKNKKIIVKILGGHGENGQGIELSEEDMKNAQIIEIDMRDGKLKEHTISDREGGKSNGQEISQEIKEAIIDHLNQQAAMGCGYSKQAATKYLNVALNISEKLDINKFKKLAFDSIFANVRLQARIKTGKYTSIPYLPHSLAASDLLLMTDDIIPVMWKGRKYTNKIDKEMLPIYLDVSGSTWSHLPEIIKLIANIGESLDYVWGFSNEIHKHTIKELQDGKINSTGGTDFDCILEHAKENQYKHIVVISDGDGSCRTSGRAPFLESAVMILFGYATKRNYFTANYETTYMIDEVKI